RPLCIIFFKSMGLKAVLSKVYAKQVCRQTDQWKKHAVAAQHKVFRNLIDQAENTVFGKDHRFNEINSYQDFKQQVPIRDYELLRPYIDRVKDGEPDVLWPGKPAYFAKTSGTTSGTKYIPISKESMPEHTRAARNALLTYIAETGNSDFVDGKMIFLQGSPVLE